jgi:hypothetical protein
MSSKTFNIGIDFGGVLGIHDNTFGAEHRNVSINMPLAVESLLKLKSLGHRLYLISFCGRSRAIETQKSLEMTNITDSKTCAEVFDEIIFVKDIEYKRYICEYLNCHFMIDDREDIQRHVVQSECKTIPILFGAESHPDFTAAKDWNMAIEIITSTPHFSTEAHFTRPERMIYNVKS